MTISIQTISFQFFCGTIPLIEPTSNISNMAGRGLSSPQVKTSPRQLRIPRSGQRMICRLVLVRLTAMRTSGLCTLHVTHCTLYIAHRTLLLCSEKQWGKVDCAHRILLLWGQVDFSGCHQIAGVKVKLFSDKFFSLKVRDSTELLFLYSKIILHI